MSDKKKKPAGKKKKKATKKSLLTRLFGDEKAKKNDKVEKKTAVRAKALTALQRSISEIKQMKKIGERDPERLAQLLATMLGQERAKAEEAKRKLNEQVWDIIHRAEQKNAEPSPEEDGHDPEDPISPN
ncbi:MAG TPA: hypothetical protein EYG11_24885 [Candidatus Latescibacteria bacterium]|nr:hypothetical protein [Candidatus Handelsmanbacteria bacterium]HIL11937.1 hypothetical protein [Candidatus Latescibacterota bacterium]